MNVGEKSSNLAKEQISEFENLYASLTGNLSTIDYLSSEIYKSVDKIRPLPTSAVGDPTTEPVGVLSSFYNKVASMQDTINKLSIIDEALKQLF